MKAELPLPQTTVVILLGASEWPNSPEFQPSEAFSNSAKDLQNYFLHSQKFNLPKKNLLNLFDSFDSPDDIDQQIGRFLEKRSAELQKLNQPARDLLVYFVGHGAFSRGDFNYYLAIRRTRANSLITSGIPIAALAETIKENARYLRRVIILDSCFASSASRHFQNSEPTQSAIKQTFEAFKVDAEVRSNLPTKGTALLCSSRHNLPSLIAPDHKYTMFSQGLLHVLNEGSPYQRNSMSLRTIARSIEDFLRSIYGDKGDPRPEVHSPDQSDGDVANVPLFPNPLKADLKGLVEQQSWTLAEIENLKKGYFQETSEIMGALLLLGDALISTLDLEQLLKGLVARLGNVMQAKHVSLLLQELNASSPWAIAQWEKQQDTQLSDKHSSILNAPLSALEMTKGEVVVFANLDKKIDLDPIAETTAVSNPREIDMIITKMVTVRQKIVYGEDIATIYKERGEKWAQLNASKLIMRRGCVAA
jgi:hypothetical protein